MASHVLALALAGAVLGVSPPTTLTMDQAVALAIDGHPQMVAAHAAQRAARDTRRASLGHMLPAVAVTDMQTWTHTNLHGLERSLGADNPAAAAFAATNPMANILGVNVTQPLSGLLGKSQTLRAAAAEEKAARADTLGARQALTLQVRQQFLALFQAKALGDTARASERALLEQVEDAEHKLAAGAAASTDVLRPRAAAAAAKQQVIAAAANEEVARTKLLELLGLGLTGEGVAFVEPATVTEVAVPANLAALRQEALAHRPEVHRAHASARAAGDRARAARLNLLPEVGAQAAWMHVFVKPSSEARLKVDAYYVGLNASWPLWQWGARYFEHQADYARASQARAQRDGTEREVGAEVAARHANLLASLGAVEAAVAESSSAEEAYRVMVATLAAEAATTSDLLQTEAARTQAKMNLVRARYDLALAKVALDHALGRED